jgi:broad specificity phosphatase PhoE
MRSPLFTLVHWSAPATAAEIARPIGLDVIIDGRFIDVDYGRWAGRVYDAFSREEKHVFRGWQQAPQRPLPGADDSA